MAECASPVLSKAFCKSAPPPGSCSTTMSAATYSGSTNSSPIWLRCTAVMAEFRKREQFRRTGMPGTTGFGLRGPELARPVYLKRKCVAKIQIENVYEGHAASGTDIAAMGPWVLHYIKNTPLPST